MKLFVIQFSLASCYILLPPGLKYSRHSVLKYFHLCCSLNYAHQMLHTNKTTVKITSQRRQPTSITSRPLPPQATGIPPPHREHRLKLRITQAVYLQSVSIKAHTIHNRVSIVGIPPPQYILSLFLDGRRDNFKGSISYLLVITLSCNLLVTYQNVFSSCCTNF
jgi:hypothetical protein